MKKYSRGGIELWHNITWKEAGVKPRNNIVTSFEDDAFPWKLYSLEWTLEAHSDELWNDYVKICDYMRLESFNFKDC